MKITCPGLLLLLSLSLSLISGVAARAQTFSLTDDLLAGGNGVFAVGKKVSPEDMKLIPYDFGFSGGGIIVFYDSESLDLSPDVDLTVGSQWTDLVAGTGFGGLDSVVRFTAPTTGLYNVSLEFRDQTSGSSADVHLVINGKSLFDDYINLEGQDFVSDYATPVPLNLTAGDMLDFVVGNGDSVTGGTAPDDGNFDSINLEATITEAPEPSTYTLLACGVLLLAGMGRLRRSAS